MVCTCEILAGGGLFGQVKSAVIKISFSNGWNTSVKFWAEGEGGVPPFYTQKHAGQIR